MSLSDNYKPVKYIGNGVTKDFSFNFNMIDSAYCRVFLQDIETGEQTPKTIEVDYTLNFGDDGGQVSMKVAPTTEQYIVVYRDVSLDQKSDFRVGDTFSATKIEEEFDKQMAAIQQMEDGLNRSPKVPEGYSVNLTLPAPDAGKGLIWNAAENGFENSTLNINEIEQLTLQYRNESQAARDEAKGYASNAKASEDNAKTQADRAQGIVDAFDAHAEEKTQDFNANAAEKQAQVDASVEKARKWAVGTIEEQHDGSAKYWAEEAESFANKANIDSIRTNCITKIPNNIKLELSNGTLTLKDGSQPRDGQGNIINVSGDKTITDTGGFTRFLFYRDTGVLFLASESNCYSGDTPPVLGSANIVWYDTTTKNVKYAQNGETSFRSDYLSLPLCKFTSTSSGITSIDQVFNGFGYIGRTIFALPNVECLAPNGRDANGKPLSTKIVVSNVLTVTNTGESHNAYLGVGDGSLSAIGYEFYRYDKERNYNLYNEAIDNRCIGTLYKTDSSARVIGFSPKAVFQAVDRNDGEWASTASKPSSRYVDLTLQASGAQYTAPANGWVVFNKKATASNQYLFLGIVSTKMGVRINSTGAGDGQINLPVKKGEVFWAFYTYAGETLEFRFVYDEGVK